MAVKLAVIIPNWNGADKLAACLDSLLKQTAKCHVIVVENGSTDESRALLYGQYPQVEVIPEPVNLGFAGGVNAGLRRAIELGYDYAALLNNDAIAEPGWLGALAGTMSKNPTAGIIASKILDSNAEYLDSTGEVYTIWGLSYPRGRREADTGQYDNAKDIFGASGGASLYRLSMLNKIGLFDEDFFAYYEDVDISFRAQLSGWKVLYEPNAKVRHHIGGTSDKIAGFGTYQTLKNLPWVAVKNLPLPILIRVLPRLATAYLSFVVSGLFRFPWPTVKGIVITWAKMPKKLHQRWHIQKQRKISVRHISSIIEHDLPPAAGRLRRLREVWQKIIRRPK